MTRPARHLANVKYAIRNIQAEAARVAARGVPLVPCNIGDPLRFDFATPPHLVAAVERALRDGHNHYVPSAGLEAAREAVAASMAPRVSPDDVFITAGVTEALDLLLTTLLEPGDEVLLPSPGYPLYTAIAARLQAVVKPYFLDEARGWAVDAAQLEAQVGPRTKALVLCNPHNPTGAVATREELLAVLDVARRHRLVVLSDEIYDRLVLDGAHVPTATLADDVPLVTLNGLSKAYLAPGWRVGWLAFHTPQLLGEVKAAVQRLADARLCGPGPFQYAVKPALEGPQGHLGEVRAKLLARRDVTVARLNALPGVSVVPPRGAFYALPSLERAWAGGDEGFVLELLRETGVLFVHGEGFGQRPGSRHFRVVFLPPEDVLHRAFDLLAGFLASR